MAHMTRTHAHAHTDKPVVFENYPDPVKYGPQLSGAGGQHAPAAGDSTFHHKHPWEFSIALENAGEQLALYWFEQERQKYAGTADVAW